MEEQRYLDSDYSKDIEEVAASSSDEDDDEPRLRIDTSGEEEDQQSWPPQTTAEHPLVQLHQLVHSPFLNSPQPGPSLSCSAEARAAEYSSGGGGADRRSSASGSVDTMSVSSLDDGRTSMAETASLRSSRQPVLKMKPRSKEPSKSRIQHVIDTLETSATELEHLNQLLYMRRMSPSESVKFQKFREMLNTKQLLNRCMSNNLDVIPMASTPTDRRLPFNEFVDRRMLDMERNAGYLEQTSGLTERNIKLPWLNSPQERSTSSAEWSSRSMDWNTTERSSLNASGNLAPILNLSPSVSILPILPAKRRRSPPPMVPINAPGLRVLESTQSRIVNRLKRLGTDVEVERTKQCDDHLIPITVSNVFNNEDDIQDSVSLIPITSPVKASVCPNPPPNLIPINRVPNPAFKLVPQSQHPRDAKSKTGGKKKAGGPSKSEYTKLAHSLVQDAKQMTENVNGPPNVVLVPIDYEDPPRRPSVVDDADSDVGPVPVFVNRKLHKINVTIKPTSQFVPESSSFTTQPELRVVSELNSHYVSTFAPVTRLPSGPELHAESEPNLPNVTTLAPVTRLLPVSVLSPERAASTPSPKPVPVQRPVTKQSVSQPEQTELMTIVPEPALRCFFFPRKHFEKVESSTGRKLFRCDVCSTMYQNQCNLKKHYIMFHINPKFISMADRKRYNATFPPTKLIGNKMFQCHVCVESYDKQMELKWHLDHHPGKTVEQVTPCCTSSYFCERCKEIFKLRGNFLKHIVSCDGNCRPDAVEMAKITAPAAIAMPSRVDIPRTIDIDWTKKHNYVADHNRISGICDLTVNKPITAVDQSTKETVKSVSESDTTKIKVIVDPVIIEAKEENKEKYKKENKEEKNEEKKVENKQEKREDSNEGNNEEKKNVKKEEPIKQKESVVKPPREEPKVTEEPKKRAYLCLFCDSSFDDINDRKRHVLQSHHPKRKEQPCTYCKNKKFSQNALLLKHLCNAHNKWYFGCLLCKTRFGSKKELIKHKLSHAQPNGKETKPSTVTTDPNCVKSSKMCPICGQTFRTNVLMGRHKRLAHATAAVRASSRRSRVSPDVVNQHETLFYQQLANCVRTNLRECVDGSQGVGSSDATDVADTTQSSLLTFTELHGAFEAGVVRAASTLSISTQLMLARRRAKQLCDDDATARDDSIQTRLALTAGRKNSDTEVTKEFSGEWVFEKEYACGACASNGLSYSEIRNHGCAHNNVRNTIHEFRPEHFPGPDWRMHALPSSVGVLRTSNDINSSLKTASRCSKCGKEVPLMADFHTHILECGGDENWMQTMVLSNSPKKHKKWRPFCGRRKRTTRARGFKRNIPTTPVKHMGMKIKTKPGDADTIQKMIANLPAKRITRRAVAFDEVEANLARKVAKKRKESPFVTETAKRRKSQEKSDDEQTAEEKLVELPTIPFSIDDAPETTDDSSILSRLNNILQNVELNVSNNESSSNDVQNVEDPPNSSRDDTKSPSKDVQFETLPDAAELLAAMREKMSLVEEEEEEELEENAKLSLSNNDESTNQVQELVVTSVDLPPAEVITLYAGGSEVVPCSSSSSSFFNGADEERPTERQCPDCQYIQSGEVTLERLCDRCTIPPKSSVASSFPDLNRKHIILVCKGCSGRFDTVSSYKVHCESCPSRYHDPGSFDIIEQVEQLKMKDCAVKRCSLPSSETINQSIENTIKRFSCAKMEKTKKTEFSDKQMGTLKKEIAFLLPQDPKKKKHKKSKESEVDIVPTSANADRCNFKGNEEENESMVWEAVKKTNRDQQLSDNSKRVQSIILYRTDRSRNGIKKIPELSIRMNASHIEQSDNDQSDGSSQTTINSEKAVNLVNLDNNVDTEVNIELPNESTEPANVEENVAVNLELPSKSVISTSAETCTENIASDRNLESNCEANDCKELNDNNFNKTNPIKIESSEDTQCQMIDDVIMSKEENLPDTDFRQEKGDMEVENTTVISTIDETVSPLTAVDQEIKSSSPDLVSYKSKSNRTVKDKSPKDRVVAERKSNRLRAIDNVSSSNLLDDKNTNPDNSEPRNSGVNVVKGEPQSEDIQEQSLLDSDQIKRENDTNADQKSNDTLGREFLESIIDSVNALFLARPDLKDCSMEELQRVIGATDDEMQMFQFIRQKYENSNINRNYEQCRVCNDYFYDSSTLKTHMEEKHEISDSTTVESSENMAVDELEADEEAKYRCGYCHRIFNNITGVILHIEEHKNNSVPRNEGDHFKKSIAIKLGDLLNNALDEYANSRLEAEDKKPLSAIKQKRLPMCSLYDPDVIDDLRLIFAGTTNEVKKEKEVEKENSDDESNEDEYPCPVCYKPFRHTHTRNRHLIMVHTPRESTHGHLQLMLDLEKQKGKKPSNENEPRQLRNQKLNVTSPVLSTVCENSSDLEAVIEPLSTVHTLKSGSASKIQSVNEGTGETTKTNKRQLLPKRKKRKKLSKKSMDLPESVVRMKAEQALLELCKTRFSRIGGPLVPSIVGTS